MSTEAPPRPATRITYAKLRNLARYAHWEVEREGHRIVCWRVNRQGVGPVDGTEHVEETVRDAYALIFHATPHDRD